MTAEHPERPGVARLVLDPGVYVSAALSGAGAPAELLETAVQGRIVLVLSPLLLGELREVLARDKLRRWISREDADAFLQVLDLLGETVEDPPEETWSRVCRDPDDDYLIALAEAAEATLLVSGDRDLLAMDRQGLDVRSPRDAVDAFRYRHPWGPALVPSNAEAAWRQAASEGHQQVLQTAAAFLAALHEPDVQKLLPQLVTPESLSAWQSDLASARHLARDRGMATRAEYPSWDVAYVKLPTDPGQTLKATGHVLLHEAIILTMQRRPELPDAVGLGGWRVHGIGDYVRPEEMPPPATPH